MRTALAALLVLMVAVCQGAARIPPVDLKQPIIWGSTAQSLDGFELSFGGQDQAAEDGRLLTRVRESGQWRSITPELRAANALQGQCDAIRGLGVHVKNLNSQLRRCFFDDVRAPAGLGDEQARIGDAVLGLANELERIKPEPRIGRAVEQLRTATELLSPAAEPDAGIRKLRQAQIALEIAADTLDCQPAARALSPLVYDPKSQRFILFGGDHLDYLANDTWTFDPASRRWTPHFPKGAPPPRGDHQLIAADGKIILTGGYGYTSSTDYCGGQYRDIGDGSWNLDLATETWSNETGRAGASSISRAYRTGPFVPEFFLEGPRPDAAAFSTFLADLPPNTWTKTHPPRLPQLNRDWGTATLDPDRGLILRFSGGHSAHGGTDVLHYHIATNRWELPYPVEFPLGQLYSNTSYPEGRNFNQRPWVTGHTYQSYAYDPLSRKMVFTGRKAFTYVYDVDLADWTDRFSKPKAMSYDSCYYTLTICPTPQGLICWTHNGELFRLDPKTIQWLQLKLTGDRLPGSVVDNSTLTFDSKRNRLLLFRKEYDAKKRYDGRMFAVDLATSAVSTLAPSSADDPPEVPYLCQIRYDADNDLCLVGATVARDGRRFTPIFDCKTDHWDTLPIAGDDPSGPKGRNVSLGMMYDAQRKLFWAVDTKSEVFVLKLRR